MKQSVTVVCYHAFGAPDAVLRIERWPLQDIKPNEVLVLMKAAPIHPADLNVLQGRYAVRPELPAVVGIEGVGVVAQKGIAVSDVRVGQLVIRPGSMGSWCEAYVAPAKELIAIPPGIETEQACMLTSVVPTAWRLLEDFVSLNQGDWLIQNAANSAVGRCVIQLARQRRLKTVNIVRRAELKDELTALGADAVLTEDELAEVDMASVTGGASIPLGLNAVSGPKTHALAKAVGPGGTVVTYGAMSTEPLSVGNAQVIFRKINLAGFWMSEWYRRVSSKEVSRMFAQLLPLVRSGQVSIPIEKTYPLEEAKEAVAHASREGRSGKVLFTMN